MENELISTARIEQLIDQKNVAEIRHIFEVIPAIDIAEACSEIEDTKKLVFIFKTVKSEFTADFFTELNGDVKENLIKIMSDADLADILEGQFTDDIVDDIEDMPANLVTRILKNVPKEKRVIINKLLNLKENTAGSIMATEFLELNQNLTPDEAIAKIRAVGKEKETVFTIFIHDGKRNLVGTLDLDDLIFAKNDQKLSEIMNRDFVTVNINTDQEEVANMVKRYDLNAIPVLNAEGRLVGLVTIDDVIDVIEQETTEDISKMQMVTPLEDSYLETSPVKMAKKCVPWIIILLVLGTFSSMVLSVFQNKLAAVAILAAFIPVLMDTGGNAGGQTIALMIRGLALKEFTPKDFWKILKKEFLSSLIIALCIGLFGFLWFTIEQYTGIVQNAQDGAIAPTIWNGQCWTTDFMVSTFRVSGAVAISLFATIIISKLVAVILPITAAAIKKDPAIVSQPILTTIVDVVSLLTYFGIATLLIINLM